MGGMLIERRGVHFIPVRHAEYAMSPGVLLHTMFYKSFSPASRHERRTYLQYLPG